MMCVFFILINLLKPNCIRLLTQTKCVSRNNCTRTRRNFSFDLIAYIAVMLLVNFGFRILAEHGNGFQLLK